MQDLFLTVIGAALVNNLILTRLFGFDPFPDGDRRTPATMALSVVTGSLIVVSTTACYIIDRAVLTPYGLGYLRIMAYAIVVVTLSRLTDRLVQGSRLRDRLSAPLPLMVINSMVLGISVLNANRMPGLAGTIFFALGTSLGFMLVLALFSALRERLALTDPPAAFRGGALVLLSVGLMSLAFMGFTGFTPP